MNNNMTLNTREMRTQLLTSLLSGTALRPLQLLSHYYSHVLERRVDQRQTLHLLHAQLAFVVAVFVSAPVLLRLLSVAWLAGALLQCRRSLAQNI